MSLATIFRELWRFVKDHLFTVGLWALIMAVVTVAGRYGIHYLLYGDNQADYQYLAEIYQQEPAEFQVLVMTNEGEIFNNAHAIDEYFASPEIVSLVEEETGIEFGQFAESERQLELYKSGNYRGALAGVRDPASGLMTFRFVLGASPEENLKIAQAYASLLAEGQVPLLNQHVVEIVRQPQIGELLDLEVYTNVALPESLNIYAKPGMISNAIYAVLGIFMGAIIGVLLAFIKHLLAPYIRYAFDYTWRYEDQHLLYHRDQTLDQDKLEALMRPKQNASMLVLSQQAVNRDNLDLVADSQGDRIYLQGLQDYPELDLSNQEVVIVIYEGLTERAWYNDQRDLVYLYELPLRIIHITD